MNEQTGSPPLGSLTPWQKQQRHLTQTGRTSRMVQDAVSQAAHGKAVYVICVSDAHAAQVKQKIREQGWDHMGISVEGPQLLRDFDWIRMKTRGAHSNCTFLVDHAVVESYFGPMLEALHKYDKE